MRDAPSSPVELLQSLVRCPSVNRVAEGVLFSEEELVSNLEELAADWGLESRRLPLPDAGCNLLLSLEWKSDASWLLFDSHLDTVGVEGMSIDPFAATIRDGKIWGRGACDTKGTAAAMLWALRQAMLEDSLRQNIAILLATDEEVSKRGIRAFVSDQLSALSWSPSAAIIGEPTSLRPVVAHNGTVRWKIVTEGVAVHSSDPALGNSAISGMVRVIDALESRYVPKLAAEHPLIGRAACSINLIQGGVQINMIPDRCEITIDRRLIPGEDGNSIVPAVEMLLDELRQEMPSLVVRQEPALVDPALSSEGNFELAAWIGDVLSQFGHDPTPVGAKYGTHASDYAATGIPSVVLGPGDIAQAHRHDEYLEIASLEAGVAVYGALMRGRPSESRDQPEPRD